MKILIVGSKGFIGSHLHQKLSAEFEVWGCDVFTDYNERNYILIHPANSDFKSVFAGKGFEICINCSGAASVPESLINPARDFELNVHNVFLLLEAIRQSNSHCKFMNLSSAAVYGNPASLPISENHPPAPLSPYGFHKEQSERLCLEYTRFFNIPTCSLRIFSAFGPGLKKQIFWDWYTKSKDARHLILPGTGKESRDYIYIDDVVNSMRCIIGNASFAGEIYNIGSGTQSVIENSWRLFLEKTNWDGTYEFDGKVRAGEPRHWQADISKIVGLGFRPLISLEEGLTKYLAWIKNLPLD